MEEEEEGRKGLSFTEEKEDEGRGKKEMQEKLNKLFGQPADPWASAGEIYRKQTSNGKSVIIIITLCNKAPGDSHYLELHLNWCHFTLVCFMNTMLSFNILVCIYNFFVYLQ